MKISTKGRYAIRVMLDLAANNTGEYIALKDVAKRQDITLKYLEQVINLLKRAGLVISYRGNNGGYMLSKAPADYKVGDILRAAEGSLAPIACLDTGEVICDRAAICPTLNFWKGLDKTVNDYVDSYTLQDLLDEQNSLGANDYCI